MSLQISNIMSLDDHVTKINLAKKNVKINVMKVVKYFCEFMNSTILIDKVIFLNYKLFIKFISPLK